jgi:hypothetical protein
MGDAKHMESSNAKPSYAYRAHGAHTDVSRPDMCSAGAAWRRAECEAHADGPGSHWCIRQ